MEEIDEMKEYLLNKFPGRDLGKPNIYVGIELERRDTGSIFRIRNSMPKELARPIWGK